MRITNDLLHARVAHTARALGCPEDTRGLDAPGYVPGTLRLRRDDAGWMLYLVTNDAGGVDGLAYGLNGREMDAFLHGLRSASVVAQLLSDLQEGDQ